MTEIQTTNPFAPGYVAPNPFSPTGTLTPSTSSPSTGAGGNSYSGGGASGGSGFSSGSYFFNAATGQWMSTGATNPFTPASQPQPMSPSPASSPTTLASSGYYNISGGLTLTSQDLQNIARAGGGVLQTYGSTYQINAPSSTSETTIDGERAKSVGGFSSMYGQVYDQYLSSSGKTWYVPQGSTQAYSTPIPFSFLPATAQRADWTSGLNYFTNPFTNEMFKMENAPNNYQLIEEARLENLASTIMERPEQMFHYGVFYDPFGFRQTIAGLSAIIKGKSPSETKRAMFEAGPLSYYREAAYAPKQFIMGSALSGFFYGAGASSTMSSAVSKATDILFKGLTTYQTYEFVKEPTLEKGIGIGIAAGTYLGARALIEHVNKPQVIVEEEIQPKNIPKIEERIISGKTPLEQEELNYIVLSGKETPKEYDIGVFIRESPRNLEFMTTSGEIVMKQPEQLSLWTGDRVDIYVPSSESRALQFRITERGIAPLEGSLQPIKGVRTPSIYEISGKSSTIFLEGASTIPESMNIDITPSKLLRLLEYYQWTGGSEAREVQTLFFAVPKEKPFTPTVIRSEGKTSTTETFSFLKEIGIKEVVPSTEASGGRVITTTKIIAHPLPSENMQYTPYGTLEEYTKPMIVPVPLIFNRPSQEVKTAKVFIPQIGYVKTTEREIVNQETSVLKISKSMPTNIMQKFTQENAQLVANIPREMQSNAMFEEQKIQPSQEQSQMQTQMQSQTQVQSQNQMQKQMQQQAQQLTQMQENQNVNKVVKKPKFELPMMYKEPFQNKKKEYGIRFYPQGKRFVPRSRLMPRAGLLSMAKEMSRSIGSGKFEYPEQPRPTRRTRRRFANEVFSNLGAMEFPTEKMIKGGKSLKFGAGFPSIKNIMPKFKKRKNV